MIDIGKASKLETAVRHALAEAAAIQVCGIHPDVKVRIGDYAAEWQAYAMAAARLERCNRSGFLQDDIMDAVEHELDQAADGACPLCSRTD